MSRGRIRTVKPEWFTDERMLGAGDKARILSVGLNTFADDEGRGKWLENRMAHDVFGLDEDPVASLRVGVAGLQGWYFHIYRVSGEGLYQVCKFRRHQRLEKAQPSKLPPCPDLIRIETARGPEFHFPSEPVSNLQTIRDSPRASSPLLPVPSSLIPDPPTLERSFRSPQGLAVRSRVDDVFKAAKSSTPTGTDVEWNKIGKRLDEESERNGGGKLADLAEAMARGFHANAKAKAAGWPLAWAVRNPIQYVREGERLMVTKPESFDDEENPL